MLREFQDEISRLREALALAEAAENGDLEAAAKLAGLQLGTSSFVDDAEGGAGGTRVAEQVKRVGVSEEELADAEREAAQRKVTAAARMATQQSELHEKTAALSSEAERAESEMKARENAIAAKLQTRAGLTSHLQELEQRLRLDRVMLDQARKEGAVLEKRRQELLRSEKETAQRRAEALQQEEAFSVTMQRAAKGEEDVFVLRKKLEKLRKDFRRTEQEAEDVQAQANEERQQLWDELRELQYHVKFQDLLLQHFVPREQAEMIEARAVWDEAAENYRLRDFDFEASNEQERRPPSTLAGCPRPITLMELVHRAKGDPSLRFASANILPMSLDPPDRTTQDWDEVMAEYQAQQQTQPARRVAGGVGGGGAGAGAAGGTRYR